MLRIITDSMPDMHKSNARPCGFQNGRAVSNGSDTSDSDEDDNEDEDAISVKAAVPDTHLEIKRPNAVNTPDIGMNTAQDS